MSKGSRVKYVPDAADLRASVGDSALVRRHKRDKAGILANTAKLLNKHQGLLDYFNAQQGELVAMREKDARRAKELEAVVTIHRHREAMAVAEAVSLRQQLKDLQEQLDALRVERNAGLEELAQYLKGLLESPSGSTARVEFGRAYNALPTAAPAAMETLVTGWAQLVAKR